MELNIQKRGYDQNKDIERMTYAKPWHMSRIPCGSSVVVRQKGGRSEGPGQSGPIQTIPESSVQCCRGISTWDRNTYRHTDTDTETDTDIQTQIQKQIQTVTETDRDVDREGHCGVGTCHVSRS